MAWKKGQSGNPKGRPKGSKHKLSEDLLSVLSKDFKEHGEKAVEELRQNDLSAYLRVIASLAPKDRRVVIDVPDLAKGGTEAIAALWSAVASGDLTPAEARNIGSIVEMHHSAVKAEDLSERLSEIERHLGVNGAHAKPNGKASGARSNVN